MQRESRQTRPDLTDPLQRQLRGKLPELVRRASGMFGEFPSNYLGYPALHYYNLTPLVMEIARGAKIKTKNGQFVTSVSCTAWAMQEAETKDVSLSDQIFVDSFLRINNSREFLHILSGTSGNLAEGTLNLFTGEDPRHQLHVSWIDGNLQREKIEDEHNLLGVIGKNMDKVGISFCIGVMGLFISRELWKMDSVAEMFEKIGQVSS